MKPLIQYWLIQSNLETDGNNTTIMESSSIALQNQWLFPAKFSSTTYSSNKSIVQSVYTIKRFQALLKMIIGSQYHKVYKDQITLIQMQ